MLWLHRVYWSSDSQAKNGTLIRRMKSLVSTAGELTWQDPPRAEGSHVAQERRPKYRPQIHSGTK